MSPKDYPRQLPLDLGHTPGLSRDELVVTSANVEAASIINRWPDWPSTVVVLAGPSGCGKSHLGAIWCEHSGAVVATSHTIPECAPAFIDNIDDGRLDETALFHLINEAKQNGQSLLLTARRFPSAWGVTLPDLASRLKAALTVEVREPDDMLLAAVITKLFADRQVEIEPHVVSYLVRRIERSLATAADVVARLDAMALDRQSRITRAMAAELVTAIDEGQTELPL